MKTKINLKKIISKTMAFFFVFCMVFQNLAYEVKASQIELGGGVSVGINFIKHNFKVSYVDNEGNQLYDSYEELSVTYEEGVTKTYSPKIADVDGYTYRGYCYEIEQSGRKVNLVDGDNPVIPINIVTEDVNSGQCTFVIKMMYTKNSELEIVDTGPPVYTNKIDYAFNVKYIDLEGKEIYDPYTEMTEGTKSTFSPKIEDIADYHYAGYYYTNETGEKDVNSEGSLSNLLTGSDPVITPHSEGKDAVKGEGVYTVYVVYYSVLQSGSYVVAYDANGGEGEVIDPNEYEANAEVTVLGGSELSREDYTFSGWNTAADGEGTEYAERDTFAITANTTLYAQWERVIKPDGYRVTYDANGGVGEVTDPNTYETDDMVTVLSGKALSREGYTFNGWNTAADGKGTEYAGGDTFAITGNTTLYAQWQAVEPGYTVTYDANGGTGKVIDPNTYTVNDTVTVLSGNALSRADYTFSGWNTAADGSGASYLAGTTFTILEDTTLYAQWNKKEAADIKATPVNNDNKGSGSNTTTTTTTKTVKTGDESLLGRYLAVMVLAAALVFISLYVRRKQKRRQDI